MAEDNSFKFRVRGLTEPLNFLTVEDLSKWIEAEIAFWSWLQPVMQQDTQLHTLYAEMHSGWSQVRHQIDTYRTKQEENKKVSIASNLDSMLSNLYSDDPKAIPSSTPKGQFIELLRKTSPVVAGHALQAFLQKERQPISNSNAVRGILQASLFELGVTEQATEAHVSALLAASDKWSGFQVQAQQVHEELAKSSAILKNEMETWRSQQQNTYEQLGVKAQADFDKIATDGRSNFDSIQKTYSEQLGLQAPVKYWEDRALSYLWTSIWFSLASIIMAVAIAGVIWVEVQTLVVPFSDYSTEKEMPQFGVHAWRYAFVIATAAFLVWPLRILVRILLSAIHLRIDARERATLAKTYLSLLRSKEGLADADRRLVLEVLFRPSSTGIVKDDAAPASMINLLSRIGSGDRK